MESVDIHEADIDGHHAVDVVLGHPQPSFLQQMGYYVGGDVQGLVGHFGRGVLFLFIKLAHRKVSRMRI